MMFLKESPLTPFDVTVSSRIDNYKTAIQKYKIDLFNIETHLNQAEAA